MRKLIRPSLHAGRSGAARRGQKRGLPPEATNAEVAYLQQVINDGATLLITLVGGRELKGRLEYYDRDCLKIEPEGGARLLLRKDKIKYYRTEVRPPAPTEPPDERSSDGGTGDARKPEEGRAGAADGQRTNSPKRRRLKS